MPIQMIVPVYGRTNTRVKVCSYCKSFNHFSEQGYVPIDKKFEHLEDNWYCCFQCMQADKYGNSAYFKPFPAKAAADSKGSKYPKPRKNAKPRGTFLVKFKRLSDTAFCMNREVKTVTAEVVDEDGEVCEDTVVFTPEECDKNMMIHGSWADEED